MPDSNPSNKTSKPENMEDIFTFSLNEHTAQLSVVFDPDSDFPSLYHGQVNIKIYPETVYFRWTILESLTIGQGTISINEIPLGDDVLGFVQAKVIEGIHNYCVKGKYVYRVQNWSWNLSNIDVEPVKKVVKLLENVRKRTRMFILQPYEVDSFLHGIKMAYKILGHSQAEEAIKLSYAELGIETRLPQPDDYTWEYVDKILQAEIISWKRTYEITA